MTETVWCEVGPALIRAWRGEAGEQVHADAVLAEAALAGLDDPLTLLDGRAVATDEVWREALAPLLGDADAAVLVHPSWWPPARVEAVARAAAGFTHVVESISRCEALVRRFAAKRVVEIAPHLVLTLDAGHPVGAERRSAAPGLVAEAVTRHVAGSSSVWVDAPAAVPGAAELAAMIVEGLHTAGTSARIADVRQLRKATTELVVPSDDAPVARRWRTPTAAAAVAVLLGGIAAAVLWVPRAAHPGPPTTALVEGRVTTRIPADWVVRRVTIGPGSARVEVASPHHAGALLHVTQARVPTDDLAATAAALRTALDAQPPGVFVDFNPSGRRAGRAAVTYREVRSGHDITWTVVVDGGVRIGIGCQAASGRRADIDTVCDEAVRTARAIA